MFQNFRRLSKFAYLKKSLDPKYGVRNFCSAISQEESEKFKVILSSNKFKVKKPKLAGSGGKGQAGIMNFFKKK